MNQKMSIMFILMDPWFAEMYSADIIWQLGCLRLLRNNLFSADYVHLLGS